MDSESSSSRSPSPAPAPTMAIDKESKRLLDQNFTPCEHQPDFDLTAQGGKLDLDFITVCKR